MKQTTNTILMIRPLHFRSNEQTLVNNHYQKGVAHALPRTILLRAQQEFDGFVDKLKQAGVNVVIVEDTHEPDTPDAVFPNNWVSFHENGNIAFYPMFAPNRRLERREDILDILEHKGFKINNLIDYTSAEEEHVYLEGTGSIVLDRENQKAYCTLSPRSNEDLFIEFCEDFEYTPVLFKANHTVAGKRKAIYHTNVMMCVGSTFAVVCLSSIDDKKERKQLVNHLQRDAKTIIDISEKQVDQFVGNMLEVIGENDKSYLVMSDTAYNGLNDFQVKTLKKHSNIIRSPLETIEACGGGSARCMIAEVFLPRV